MSDKNLRLQVLLSAVDKVTRPFKSMQASNKALAASVKATKDQLKQLDNQAGKIEQLKKRQETLRAYSDKLRLARSSIKSVNQEIANSGVPTRKQTQQLINLALRTDRLKNSAKSLTARIKAQRNELNAAGIDTRNLSEAQRSLRSSINGTNRALAIQEKRLEHQAQQQKRLTDARSRYQNAMGVRNQLAGTGAGMLITGRMAIAGIKPVLDESATYSQHVERFRAQGVTDRQIQDSQTFVRTHPVIGASQTELMKLYGEAYAITRDEHHTQDATVQLARAETAINMLGAKGLLTPEQTHAFSELSYAMLKNAELRNEIQDPKQFASFINESVKAFAVTQTIVTPKDTNDFMKTGGLAAKDISRDEYFYAFSHLIQEMGGERTGNALNSARQNWISKRIKERSKDEMDKIGLIDNVTYSKTGHVKDFNLVNQDKFNTAPFKYLMEEVVPRIEKRYPGLSEEGIQLKISDLFSHRTASDLFATMYNQRENITKQMAAGKKVQDMDTIINNGEKTAPGQELILEAKKRDLYKQLGNNILPLYVKGLTLINNALTSVSAFIDKHPKLAKYFILGAAGMAILVTVSGALMLAIAALLGPFAMLRLSTQVLGIRLLPGLAQGMQKIGRVFSWVATSPLRFLRFTLAGVSGLFGSLLIPLGLVAAAIAGAGLLIYKYWKPIKAFLGGVVEGFKNATAPIKEAFAPLAPVFTWIGDKVKALWGWFTDLLTPVNSTKESLDNAASAGKQFGEFLAAGIELAMTPLRLLIDSIKWVLDKLDEIKARSAETRKLSQENPAVAAAARRAGVMMTPGPTGNSVDAIRYRYTGEHDNGGRIPLGKFGIVGEYGPEIVSGPVNVTSRRNTAAMAAVAALFMNGATAADAPLHPHSLAGNQYRSAGSASYQRTNAPIVEIHAPITINPQPGQSALDIAREVARQLDARERQARAKVNSSYNDFE
ncbi:phage tail tape measure protein [Serratia marcescens]|uniref:phage tail tape measure protein n=1 Tax=Serratia marcescens TaxID=615 RepID=UPI003EDB50F1